MSRNPKLSDLQLILLATAAQRKDGSIFPPAESIAHDGDRIRKAIPPLLRRALVEQVPVTDRTRAWREEDQQPVGLVITVAGRAIIAAEDGVSAPGEEAATQERNDDKPSPAARAASKTELVLGLLRRPEGATIADLTDATGWLPHTTRARLRAFARRATRSARASGAR